MQLFQAERGGNLSDSEGFGHSPEEFLANEEALLEYCEATDHPGFLAFWESNEYFVVLGYGKHLAAEVHEVECHRLKIPVLRRASGGGTVLQGPGCLNYTVVLPIEAIGELGSITGANRYIMEKNRVALAPLLQGELKVQGHTDLTLDGLKFSGNAQRRKRRCLLFHGSFLLDFDLDLISRTLRAPEQQPEYRRHRPHRDFLRNIQLNHNSLPASIQLAWQVTTVSTPETIREIKQRAEKLVAEKYSQNEWNRRL